MVPIRGAGRLRGGQGAKFWEGDMKVTRALSMLTKKPKFFSNIMNEGFYFPDISMLRRNMTVFMCTL